MTPPQGNPQAVAPPEAARPKGNSSRLLRLRALLDVKLASLYYSIRRDLARCRGEVLEVGCGSGPYRRLLGPEATYHGIDHATAGEFGYHDSDVRYYQGDVFPEDSGKYDWVFHTEVIEHVPAAQPFLAECHRVLKEGGEILFTSPFSYRYHYIPHDYFRYTPAALRDLLTQAGFVDVRISPQGTDITVISHKILVVASRAVSAGGLARRLLGALAVLALLPALVVVHAIGMASLFVPWGSTNDPLGYLVQARKPQGA